MKIYSLAFAVICLSSACKETIPTQETKVFEVINPIIKDTIYEREYAAAIQSIQNVDIRNKVKGFIEEINVDEGQKVTKGQTLFKLNNGELEQLIRKAEALIQSAQAELKGTELEYENTRKLFEKNIVSKSELELYATKVQLNKAKLNLAKVEKEQAELHNLYTTVRAPFSGVINRIPFKKGSLVDEGSLLTSISNNEFVYAYFNVSEIDYLDYQLSQKKSNQVKLILANNQPYPEKGIIETTESEIDASTGNIAFRAKFHNKSQILKQGSSGKIVVPAYLKSAILIPQKSSFEVQGNIFIYTVNKQNIVKAKRIIPLFRLSNFYVVTDGLTKEDLIILEGIQSLREGDKIEIKMIPMPTFS